MFKIEKTGKNAFKYLTDCENQHLGLNNQIFAKYLGKKAAIAAGSFLAWLSVLTAFVTTVSVCLNSLYGTVQAGVATAGSWGAKALRITKGTIVTVSIGAAGAGRQHCAARP